MSERTWGVDHPEGHAIGPGIRDGGTGWATFHNADEVWNYDVALTADQVDELLARALLLWRTFNYDATSDLD